MSGTYLFIESSGFTSVMLRYFGADERFSEFQTELACHPEKGSVISGAAPLRKIRWGDHRRGTGTRGGLRVIYIHIPDIRVLYLLDVYNKDEADDLTIEDRKHLQHLARQLIDELRQRHHRGKL